MATTAGPSLPAARVVLLTRPGCHLCVVAREVVDAVVAETGDDVAEVCVDDDPAMLAAYSEQVPVTFVDGRQHDYWRVDPGRLRAALARSRGAGPVSQHPDR